MADWRGRVTSAAPQVLYGEDAILRLPEVLTENDWHRVLLVCGRRSFEASGAARVLPELNAQAEVRRWSDFTPNTDSADLVRGIKVVGAFEPDVVLGVGGGSAMDMAKLLCAYDDVSDVDLLAKIRSGEQVTQRGRGLILVPTTSGSGSEATHFAVVYIGDEKFSVAGQVLRPDAIVLDPSLGCSASPYQRASSGIDAVCQAIESLWASGATRRSRGFARFALRLLLPSIEPFVHEPGRRDARAMCLGSHLAGRAIDVSKTTAAHALSYAITKGYGVSHGHAVALTLGAFIEAHAAGWGELQPDIVPEEHHAIMREICAYLDARSPAEARESFRRLVSRLGLPTLLSDVGIKSAPQRQALVAAVNLERLGNNPVLFDPEGLLDVLERSDA